MLIALPLSCVVVLSIVFYLSKHSNDNSSLRLAIIKAVVACGAYLICAVETLSVFKALSPWGINNAWVFFLTACVGWVFVTLRKGRNAAELLAITGWRPRLSHLLVLGGLGLLAWEAFYLVQSALLAPPNSWDAMTYHLPRALHWLEQGSLEHYPTRSVRQLFLNPYPSFLHLQNFAFGVGEPFANMIQVCFFLLSWVVVSEICRLLGGNGPLQVGAAVLLAALPIGILESTGTLSDCIHTFWQLAALLFVLRLGFGSSVGRSVLAECLFLGLAVGVSIAAKGTAVLFFIPLGLILLSYLIVRRRASILLPLLVSGLLAGAINAPYWLRNYELFGHPLGPTAGDLTIDSLKNDRISLGGTISNILRNLSLHLVDPDPQSNLWWVSGITQIHESLGLPLNDPGNTWPGTSFPLLGAPWDENLVANRLHLLLVVVSFVLLPFLYRKPYFYSWALIAAISIFDFIIFCAVLKWQPWHTRLHLVLFAQAVPVVAFVAQSLLSRWGLAALCIYVWLQSEPIIFHNMHRPLAGESGLRAMPDIVNLFRAQPELQSSISNLSDVVRKQRCGRIGLIMGEDDWEYPLWHLLRNSKGVRPHLMHAACEVKEFPHKQIEQEENACMLIWFDAPAEAEVLCYGRSYQEIFREGKIALFKKVER